MTTLAPKRRWLRFSLRTLFLIVTVFGCWLGYELNWIRQRRAILPRCQWAMRFHLSDKAEVPPDYTAPNLLWLFGEPGYADVCLAFKTDHDRKLTAAEEKEVERARRLFPEADRVIGVAFPPVVFNPDPPPIAP